MCTRTAVKVSEPMFELYRQMQSEIEHLKLDKLGEWSIRNRSDANAWYMQDFGQIVSWMEEEINEELAEIFDTPFSWIPVVRPSDWVRFGWWWNHNWAVERCITDARYGEDPDWIERYWMPELRRGFYL